MSELPVFDDNSISATPVPVHSSSVSSKPKKRTLERDFDVSNSSNDSLGLISSLVLNDIPSRSSFYDHEVSKAKESLERFSHRPLTTLPSFCYKRTAEISTQLTHHFPDDSSTISESDLLPENSSTPRESLYGMDLAVRRHMSMGKNISNFAESLRNSEIGPFDMLEKFSKTVEFPCTSSEQAIAKFVEDEKSWRREKNIPVSSTEISVISNYANSNVEMSVSSYFRKGCEEPRRFFPGSPEKIQEAVPLIDLTTTTRDSEETSKSIGVSFIQKVLSSQESPNAIIQKLLKTASTKKEEIRCDKEPCLEGTGCIRKKKTEETRPASDHLEVPISGHKSLESSNNCDIKENISPEFDSESRSSSSLSTLPSGKLPIACTKNEIVWGSVKTDRNNSQMFVIRNKHSGRLSVICTVTNPCFRLHKEHSDGNFSSTLKIVLHPYESRPLWVTFAPTTIGAVVDVVSFKPANTMLVQTAKQFIKMYGYGGHGDVNITGLFKDGSGKYLCHLGLIEQGPLLKNVFVLKNKGAVSAFAYIQFSSNSLYPFIHVEVKPMRVILIPGEEKEVVVTAKVTLKDRTFIKSKTIIDLGEFLLVHGSEIDRFRLRKLCEKAKTKGWPVQQSIQGLVEQIPGELPCKDLKFFRESVQAIEDLIKAIKREKFIVTAEQAEDGSISSGLHEADQTEMYMSLCDDTKFFDGTIAPEMYKVEPTKIFLTPPTKVRDVVFISNFNQKTVYFEINCVPQGLSVKPREGMMKPGENLMLEVMYDSTLVNCNKTVFNVKVLVDNESFNVEVVVVNYIRAQ